MIIAGTAAAVIIALDIMIWVPLALRRLRVPSVRVLPHPGRHVSAERVHCGGRYLGTMPRRDAVPLTEQEIERVYVPGCPWTGGQPVLPAVPQVRELPVFNEVPQLEVLKRTADALRNLDAGERLAKWLIA